MFLSHFLHFFYLILPQISVLFALILFLKLKKIVAHGVRDANFYFYSCVYSMQLNMHIWQYFLCFTPCTSRNLVGEMENWVRECMEDCLWKMRLRSLPFCYEYIRMWAWCMWRENLLWITKWPSTESHKSFCTHEKRLKIFNLLLPFPYAAVKS